ncbi:hypothetical protein [Deinococcus multiflagellatus]|uniref:Uncharacterized protein n=1 Tax=Deinococcus multiflagellatus TaxID=1656887 RepID=A0ABW1ZEH0_9DEIO|nr:hypothetical protein [Deinococcus multiflagellatus]MBZ9712975.1 hypothetical protein [Deinococcus multiflagellatus]
MPSRLNLAALTDEELQALVGQERAVALLPEISAARLVARPVPGPPVSPLLTAEALPERPWGASPEDSRALGALSAELLAAQATAHGTFYLPTLNEVRHLRAYTLDPDTSAALRWSETPESAGAGWPFVQLLTWLRDRASGLACVLTTSAPHPLSPSPGAEVDVHQHPGAGVAELVGCHRQHVARHGRGQKLAPDSDWLRPWQALHALNLAAWNKRGLLVDSA